MDRVNAAQRPPASKFRRLAITHALMMGGDAAMVVALADSLFFDIDLDAARSRVLLFLVIGFAPFLVVAPLIGPLIDRVAGGRKFVIEVVALSRVILTLLMAQYLDALALFPLVFASLANGVLQLGELTHLGPLAGRTFTLFFANMLIAVTLGLVMMNVLQPGGRLDEETSTRLVQEYSGQAQKHVETSAARPGISPAAVVDMFMPRNLFGAFVGNQRNVLGDVLPLIMFAILVGAAGLKLPEPRRKRLLEGLDTVADLMTGIVHFALRLAPYAVPAMIFSVVVKVGFDILVALGLNRALERP